jgi:uncharacterized membrane protein YgcG
MADQRVKEAEEAAQRRVREAEARVEEQARAADERNEQRAKAAEERAAATLRRAEEDAAEVKFKAVREAEEARKEELLRLEKESLQPRRFVEKLRTRLDEAAEWRDRDEARRRQFVDELLAALFGKAAAAARHESTRTLFQPVDGVVLNVREVGVVEKARLMLEEGVRLYGEGVRRGVYRYILGAAPKAEVGLEMSRLGLSTAGRRDQLVKRDRRAGSNEPLDGDEPAWRVVYEDSHEIPHHHTPPSSIPNESGPLLYVSRPASSAAQPSPSRSRRTPTSRSSSRNISSSSSRNISSSSGGGGSSDSEAARRTAASAAVLPDGRFALTFSSAYRAGSAPLAGVCAAVRARRITPLFTGRSALAGEDPEAAEDAEAKLWEAATGRGRWVGSEVWIGGVSMERGSADGEGRVGGGGAEGKETRLQGSESPVPNDGRRDAGDDGDDDGPDERMFVRARRPRRLFVAAALMWEAPGPLGAGELFLALGKAGWKPVYVRGSGTFSYESPFRGRWVNHSVESGQTWFLGPDPVYVRFLKPDYVPQLDDADAASGYLLLGGELVEKQALEMAGIEHKMGPQGHYALDPSCTYVSEVDCSSASLTDYSRTTYGRS